MCALIARRNKKEYGSLRCRTQAGGVLPAFADLPRNLHHAQTILRALMGKLTGSPVVIERGVGTPVPSVIAP